MKMSIFVHLLRIDIAKQPRDDRRNPTFTTPQLT